MISLLAAERFGSSLKTVKNKIIYGWTSYSLTVNSSTALVLSEWGFLLQNLNSAQFFLAYDRRAEPEE